MDESPAHLSEELWKLAAQLREAAGQTDLPGYAEKMIHAAEALEKQARELEALSPTQNGQADR